MNTRELKIVMAEIIITAIVKWSEQHNLRQLERIGYAEIIYFLRMVELKDIVDHQSAMSILDKIEISEWLSEPQIQTLRHIYNQGVMPNETTQLSVLYSVMERSLGEYDSDYGNKLYGYYSRCNNHVEAVCKYFNSNGVVDIENITENFMIDTFVGQFIKFIYTSLYSMSGSDHEIVLEISDTSNESESEGDTMSSNTNSDTAAETIAAEEKRRKKIAKDEREIRNFCTGIENYITDLQDYTGRERAMLFIDKVLFMPMVMGPFIANQIADVEDMPNANEKVLGVMKLILEEIKNVRDILKEQ
jgi:hypothetical protein